MANKTLSELTAAIAAKESDVIHVNQDNVDRKLPIGLLSSMILQTQFGYVYNSRNASFIYGEHAARNELLELTGSVALNVTFGRSDFKNISITVVNNATQPATIRYTPTKEAIIKPGMWETWVYFNDGWVFKTNNEVRTGSYTLNVVDALLKLTNGTANALIELDNVRLRNTTPAAELISVSLLPDVWSTNATTAYEVICPINGQISVSYTLTAVRGTAASQLLKNGVGQGGEVTTDTTIVNVQSFTCDAGDIISITGRNGARISAISISAGRASELSRTLWNLNREIIQAPSYYKLIASNYTIQPGDKELFVDATSGVRTITPATLPLGSSVIITKIDGSANYVNVLDVALRGKNDSARVVSALNTAGNITVIATLINSALIPSDFPEVYYPGMIMAYGGNALAPDGWMFCRGQSLAISAYPALFAVIGFTFGSNGSSNFLLPNMCGRAFRGFNPSSGIDAGRAFGSQQDWAVPEFLGETITGAEGKSEHVKSDRSMYTTVVTESIHRNTGGASDKSKTKIGINTRNQYPNNTTPVSAGARAEVRVDNIAINYIIKV